MDREGEEQQGATRGRHVTRDQDVFVEHSRIELVGDPVAYGQVAPFQSNVFSFDSQFSSPVFASPQSLERAAESLRLAPALMPLGRRCCWVPAVIAGTPPVAG